MIKKFLSQNIDFIYYFIRSIDSKKRFIVITPNFFSIIINKVLIFDKYKKNFLFITINNLFDFDTILEIFGLESYNLNNHKLFKELLKKYGSDKLKSKLIIDCGANIGCSSIYFQKIVENSKIIAIEPDKKNYELLKKNFSEYKGILINSAVANSKENYEILENENKRAIRVNDVSDGDNKTVTIKEIIQNYNNDDIHFILKIDIEGFEKNLFEKNSNWVFEFDIIIIEIHDYLYPKQKISETFFRTIYKNKTHNYDCVLQGENLIFYKIS